ncbi:unnamed protein product [Closterium sp. Naga37s-1]|nr:unnamed protein product [Closterium sp. Naga37s-1]
MLGDLDVSNDGRFRHLNACERNEKARQEGVCPDAMGPVGFFREQLAERQCNPSPSLPSLAILNLSCLLVPPPLLPCPPTGGQHREGSRPLEGLLRGLKSSFPLLPSSLPSHPPLLPCPPTGGQHREGSRPLEGLLRGLKSSFPLLPSSLPSHPPLLPCPPTGGQHREGSRPLEGSCAEVS